jgi:hypothetical protein
VRVWKAYHERYRNDQSAERIAERGGFGHSEILQLTGGLAQTFTRTYTGHGQGAVHWIGDAPTSLHGNGASSFRHTSRDATEVTCKLCLALLARHHSTDPGGG